MGWAERLPRVKRRYTFDDTEQGALQCTLAWTAMANRGSPREGSRVSAEDKRSEGRIVRQLKALTVPVATQPEPERGQPDLRARQLITGGGTLELDQADFKRLVEYIESMQWSGAITDDASDLLDALDTCEKVKEEPPEKAKD